MGISEIISKYKPDLTKYENIYKDLHENPGLSLQEDVAAELARGRLTTLSGYEVRTNIGGKGLIGILANGTGPTVVLRADMDALPVEELTDLPYASKRKQIDIADGIRKPVMHACGHDMHVASMLAAAETLSEAKHEWKGTLVILFQPNEERGSGARAMIDDGLYNPKRHGCPIPDVVLGQHVMPFASGDVGTNQGIFASAADSMKVTVYGKGGHASQPHVTIDPVLMAANIIVRLQGVVSREVNPRDTAVVTVSSVVAGMAENIIADHAVLKINVRNFNPQTREKVLEAIKRIVKAECDASNAPKEPLFEPISNFPFLFNDPEVTQKLSRSFDEVFGENHIQNCDPLGGSEDFGILATEAPNKYGGKGVPSCYWLFGGIDSELYRKAQEEGKLEDIPINHSPLFAPVIQPTLEAGMKALVSAALTFLG